MIYKQASKEVHKLCKTLVEENYDKLAKEGVTFDILMAFAPENEENGEPTGPAIKLHGYTASAIVSTVPLKNRVKGLSDVEIIIDGLNWEKLNEEERAALLDHELYHVQVSTNSKGETIKDTAGRPKIKMRLHDIQLGWFIDIAKRHGMSSGEVQQAQTIVSHAQAFFPFLDNSQLVLK